MDWYDHWWGASAPVSFQLSTEIFANGKKGNNRGECKPGCWQKMVWLIGSSLVSHPRPDLYGLSGLLISHHNIFDKPRLLKLNPTLGRKKHSPGLMCPFLCCQNKGIFSLSPTQGILYRWLLNVYKLRRCYTSYFCCPWSSCSCKNWQDLSCHEMNDAIIDDITSDVATRTPNPALGV